MNAEYVFIIMATIAVIGVVYFVSLKKKKQSKQQLSQQVKSEEKDETDTVRIVDSSISQEDYFKERQSYLSCYKNLLIGLKSEECVDYLKYQMSNDRFISKIDSHIQNENKLISSSQKRHPKNIEELVLIIENTLKNIEHLGLESVSSLDMFNLSHVSTSLNFIRGQYIDLVELVSKIPEFSSFVAKFESGNRIYKPKQQDEEKKEQQKDVEVINYEEKYKALLLESERISLDLEQAKQSISEKETQISGFETQLKDKGEEIKALESFQRVQSRQINALNNNLENIKRKIQTMDSSEVKSELSNMVDLNNYVERNKYSNLEDEHKKVKSRQVAIIVLLSFIMLIAIVGVVIIVFQNKTNDIIYNNKKAVESSLLTTQNEKDILIEIIKKDIFIQLERYDFNNEESLRRILESKDLEYKDVLDVVGAIKSENDSKTSTLEKLKKSRDTLNKEILSLEKEKKEKEDQIRILREQNSAKQGEILELERQIKEKQLQIELKTKELESSSTPHTSEVITQPTPTT